MKICMVTTNFPRYLGDNEGTFIFESAHAIAKQGHRVRVIAQHWPGYPTREQMGELEVIRPRYWWPEAQEKLRQEGGGLPIVWKQSFWVRFQMIPFIIIHTLAVARYARGYDVIHAQWTLSAGAAWLSKIIHRRPVLATLQGSDVFQVTLSKIGRWLTWLVLRNCDQISVLSRALAKGVEATGIAKEKITIIPNGVDITLFSPMREARKQVILYVGSLIKRKGVNYLLEAMPAIGKLHPSYQLVIVGDGPERASLEALAEELDIMGKVVFTGALVPEQVLKWMQQTKLFVLPSVEEGLGVVLLESLACATPIVASEVGGIPDVVTSDVGILAPPKNSKALAEAIITLLSDETKWLKMSIDARKRAEKYYNWNNIAKQFVEIYHSMLT